MVKVGEILRTVRQRRGLGLDRVAEDLRISRRYLAAIEADDISQLPGVFFYRSFLRQYASYLQLEPPELDIIERTLKDSELKALPPLEIYKTPIEVPRLVVVDGRRIPRKDQKRWLLAVASLVAAVVGCGLVYAGWQKYYGSGWLAARSLTSPPAQSKSTPSASMASQSEPREGAGALAVLPSTEGLQPGAEVRTASGDPSSEKGASFFQAPIRITVRAIDRTWVRVTSDGNVLFVGMMEPNDQKTFVGQAQARMLVGNAGGLEVQWNGQLVGPIGFKGQVRIVEFTPTEYQVLPSIPKQARVAPQASEATLSASAD